MSTPTTHPIIDRLADLKTEELTMRDVAAVLGRGLRYAEALIRDGKIESWRESARAGQAKDTLGRAIHYRYTVTTAAMLAYLVRSTTQDKAALMYAIETRFPHHLKFCEKLAQSLEGKAPAPALQSAPPANVLPFKKVTWIQTDMFSA